MTTRSDYLRDALDVRRLIRAHKFDDARLTQDIEVCYFFDASVLIDMVTIDKLAHVTNLFNLCPPERLDAFFKMRMTEEIGADATAVIVGAFETFNYLASGKLPSQKPNVILQTEEHRFELGNYGAYLLQRIDDHVKKHQKPSDGDDEADDVGGEDLARTDANKFEAKLEKQFGDIDDHELLKLFPDAAAMERLKRLQTMQVLLTENTAIGVRLEPAREIQEALRRRIVAIRPHQQKNADRDAKSLAKLIALQRLWFHEKSKRRCIFVTNDHAIHRVYREFFFKGFPADQDLGKIDAERLRCGDNPDDWYILRDPAQYAAVLNTRELKALAGAEPPLDQKVLVTLGDATYAVLSAHPIRVRDENGNEAQREYVENGAFEDNVDRDYSFGNVGASRAARARLYPNWRSAMLTSVAINSAAAKLDDILDDMNKWVGKATTQKQLLNHIRAAADGALLTHAMFALETVREFRSDRTPGGGAPLRALVIRVNNKSYTLDPDKPFAGRMDEFFGATTECLAHDAWAPAMFFARSARSKCERENASAEVMQEALYLFSLAARLGVTRARDLIDALAAIDKAVELSADADPGYGFRARSEQLSVQMTQWLHGINARETWWPTPLRLPGVQLADFLKQIGENFPETAKERMRNELALLQSTRGGQWRNDVKRHLSVNLYIAQVLSCDPQKVAKLKEADAAVDEYLDGEQPLLLSTVRHVARYVVNRKDTSAAELLRKDLTALRSISLEQPRQPANRTDRLLIEYLCKRYDINV